MEPEQRWMAAIADGDEAAFERLVGLSAASALVVGLLASPVFAQAGPTTEDFQRRVERWRAQLRKRYQQFRKLPAPERRRLIERHRRLRKPKVRPLHPRPAAPPHRPPVRLPHRR
ncbi:MAG: hypothetical protein V3U45_01355 [bacterium]